VAFTGSRRGIYLNTNATKNQAITHIRDHYGFTGWAYYFEDGIDYINHPGRKSEYSSSVSFVGGG
jgi:mRNA deadenylase 3'-5' endonuclease subunit Ccr4